MYTFLAIVRSSVPSLPSALTFVRVHVLTSSNPPQTSPAIGISFCLILARLGRLLHEVQDETWHVSVRWASALQTRASDQVAVSLAQVKVQSDVRVSEPTDSPIQTLESGKQGYVDSPGDLSEISRTSLSHPSPA
jgi:hypothetical protein